MKTKDENLTQNYDSKLKISSSLNFKFCFRIFRFSVLAFCLLPYNAGAETSPEQLDPTDLLVSRLAKTSQYVDTPSVLTHVVESQPTRQELSKTKTPTFLELSDIVPVNFAAQVDQNLPQSSFNTAENQDNDLRRRRLWQARISVPEGEEDKKNKDELQQIIKQISSIEFKPPRETHEPVIVIEPAPANGPNKASTDTEAPEEPKGGKIEPKLPYEPVTDQTLQILKNLLQHPDQLGNPLELGEVLFLSGHLKEAAIVYKEALKRKSPDEASAAQDRVWILFQIGNCLRNDDLPTAAKMYSQLIAEYPDSPWSDLAKAQYKLIDWYLKDKPQTLIAESQF